MNIVKEHYECSHPDEVVFLRFLTLVTEGYYVISVRSERFANQHKSFLLSAASRPVSHGLVMVRPYIIFPPIPFTKTVM